MPAPDADRQPDPPAVDAIDPANPEVLQACGVTFGYGAVAVLRGVDLRVTAGQTVGVTGPSGSGKSTLMGILGLLAVRDAGELSLLSQPVPRRPPGGLADRLRRRIGWIPQLPMVLRGRTALDNALLGAYWHPAGRPSPMRVATDAFAALGMADRAHLDAAALSGGELQRLAVIRAIARRPELILADEPTASLDAANTGAVIDALRYATGFGAVVIASHDPRVMALCGTVFELRDGRLQEYS